MEHRRVFVVGYMGVGKSSSGRRLASLMGLPFMDTDTKLRERHQASIPDMFEQMGEAGFREQEQRVLEQLVESHRVALISTGGGLACHLGNMAFMRSHGTVVYLKMTAVQLAQRLRGKTDERPLIAGVDPEELEGVISQHLEQREKHYAQAHITVDAENLDSERMNSIRNLIEGNWGVSP